MVKKEGGQEKDEGRGSLKGKGKGRRENWLICHHRRLLRISVELIPPG